MYSSKKRKPWSAVLPDWALKRPNTAILTLVGRRILALGAARPNARFGRFESLRKNFYLDPHFSQVFYEN